MAKLTFGATLRKLRESKRMSLRKTAAAAEISPTYLAQLERDESTPSQDVVFNLADALDCDQDELLAMTGRIADDVLNVIRKNPRAVAALLLAVEDLPEEQIDAIVRQVEKRKAKRRFGAGI
jgi:transcriptional regulator with XRE-family HTH domain